MQERSGREGKMKECNKDSGQSREEGREKEWAQRLARRHRPLTVGVSWAKREEEKKMFCKASPIS